jgi:hypothetical protein
MDKVENDAFKLSIIKNQSYDKKKVPFRFDWKAVEPEESKETPFEIEPKQVAVSARSLQEFTVTFNPSKATGIFDATLLASPELSQDEVEITEDPKDLPKKGTLGNIALKLQATTIKPFLTFDKGVRLDGSQLVKISKWSYSDEEAPNTIKKLVLANNSKADMTFNLGVDGPFEIVKTKSNTGAKHPLAS